MFYVITALAAFAVGVLVGPDVVRVEARIKDEIAAAESRLHDAISAIKK